MNNKSWFQNPREAQAAGGASIARTPAPSASATAAAPSHASHPPSNTQPAAASTEPAPSQLIVGPKIRLNGAEIEQCDTLVIEGHVKATVKSRTLRISATGTFEGDADIETAEIEGSFNGTLNASTRLVVKAAGRVTGTIRYGKLVVEDGGELGGDVRPIGESQAARPGTQPRKDAAKDTTVVRDGLLSPTSA